MLAERVEEWARDWQEKGWQEGIQRGIQEGIQRGIQQGRLDDARDALADVIEVRFGGVPSSLRERISRLADVEVLRALRRRAAAAGSLEEIEAETPAGTPQG